MGLRKRDQNCRTATPGLNYISRNWVGHNSLPDLENGPLLQLYVYAFRLKSSEDHEIYLHKVANFLAK